MLYFSEVKNKKVFTEDGVYIGKIDDLIFRYTETPYITKILVKPVKQLSNENLFIPIENILKLNTIIAISKNYQTSSLSENELFVARNLIDKQIIDISGNKVVRVNDVIIQKKNGNCFFITGVDIGILGILRWFGIEKIISIFFSLFKKPLASSIVSWSNIQPLELSRGKIMLNVKQDKLEKLHPADLADYLEITNLKNIIKIINLLDRDFAAKVISELNLNYQISLLKNLEFKKTLKIISLIDPDEAVDILTQLSPKRRKAILDNLDNEKRKEIKNLLRFGNTSVGKFLTTEFLTVKSSDTVSYIIDKIKHESADMSFLAYVYVINENNQLLGVFNLHELVLQQLDTPAYKFMAQNVAVVHLTTSLLTVFRKFIKYKISGLPVIDNDKKLIGIVTMDDIGEIFLDKI